MMYEYKALQGGARTSGSVEADTRQAAVQQLRRKGLSVLFIREAAGKAAKVARAKTGRAHLDTVRSRLISKVQVEVGLRQLASLLNAGVPIITAFTAVAAQTSGIFAKVLGAVSDMVRQGNSLEKSLKEKAPFLGRVILGLIGVGEANGSLDEMLLYSAELMENARKVRGQIVQALAYPSMVVMGAMGVTYYLVAVVFPQIMVFIQKQGKNVPLPAPTRILITVSDFCEVWGPYMLAVPVVLVVGLALLRRMPKAGAHIDRSLLGLPVVGKALRDHCNTMWCRTMGALLKSGVNAVETLELVGQAMGNIHYANQFKVMRDIVRKGRSITVGLRETDLHKLCPMAMTMVAVSEETGALDESLFHVAAYSEECLSRRVALMSKMVEPIIFLIVGGIVGFVYFAFFMAMLAVNRSAT